MDEWAEKVKLFYPQKLKQYWQERYKEYCEERDDDGKEFLEEYLLLWLGRQENRQGIPQGVLDAFDFYYENVEKHDWGAVQAFKVNIEGGDTFAVIVSTDGDDGWLEVFDEQGQNLGAARTYIELVAWGDMDSIREQVHTRDFPAELDNKMELTLWGKPLV